MILSTIVDISERQRAAEREKLLVRELYHRSNNLFALVQAIVATSLSGDLAMDQARRALHARLEAMARTHRTAERGQLERFSTWPESCVRSLIPLQAA